VHYGIFCLAHGMFILVVFNFDELGTGVGLGTVLSSSASFLGWAAAGLGASHLYSFMRNYLGRGEYRRTIVTRQMFEPYARVVVLHLAILFGVFIAVGLGSNMGILVILVVGKTVLDLAFHLRERERNSKSSQPTRPENILHEDPRQ
jgi:uncharacterized membrane-anchored protein